MKKKRRDQNERSVLQEKDADRNVSTLKVQSRLVQQSFLTTLWSFKQREVHIRLNVNIPVIHEVSFE